MRSSVPGVYVDNEGEDRKRLWSQLERVEGKIDDEAWMVIGDLYIVRNSHERRGEQGVCIREVQEFK